MFDGSMSISFYKLNYPAQFLGQKYRQRTHSSAKLFPALATQSSSILVHSGESDNSQKCGRSSIPNISLPNKDCSGGSVLNQANAIGIIGGASIDSTVNFLQKLTQWRSEERKDCPPFLLCSDAQLREELLVYERSSSLSLYTRAPSSHFDYTPIVENLRHKREYLVRGGSRCLVMPCHLLHSWHDDISNGCSIPILHMGECVAKELKEAKLKPLETGSPLRIGLVATDAILRAGVYQKKIQAEGFEAVLPDKATMEHILLPAMEALNRKDIEGARNLLRIALQVLLVRAVNMVIIASHDFCNLLPQDDPLLKKCIDPVDALVRSTIRWSQSVEECSS